MLHSPKDGILAAAYYDPEQAVLHIMDDTKDTAEWDLACLGRSQTVPNPPKLTLYSHGTAIAYHGDMLHKDE